VLNAAAHILFLVSGGEKAARLAQVLQGPFQPDLVPAQAVKPIKGNTIWLVDQAAVAMLLPRKHH
jgi:6-phosphogluconolactonase